MAIRPTDLQNAFNQTILNQPISQRAEEAPHAAQAAQQAAFVAKTEERNETCGRGGLETPAATASRSASAPDREPGGGPGAAKANGNPAIRSKRSSKRRRTSPTGPRTSSTLPLRSRSG